MEAEAEARAAANASARAFRPPYEEVRKRTLRIRLHAEERAERQIGRALSRADRDLQHKDQKLKELGFAKDPVVKPEIEEIERKREIVREGRKKIKAAHEARDAAKRLAADAERQLKNQNELLNRVDELIRENGDAKKTVAQRDEAIEAWRRALSR